MGKISGRRLRSSRRRARWLKKRALLEQAEKFRNTYWDSLYASTIYRSGKLSYSFLPHLWFWRGDYLLDMWERLEEIEMSMEESPAGRAERVAENFFGNSMLFPCFESLGSGGGYRSHHHKRSILHEERRMTAEERHELHKLIRDFKDLLHRPLDAFAVYNHRTDRFIEPELGSEKPGPEETDFYAFHGVFQRLEDRIEVHA